MDPPPATRPPPKTSSIRGHCRLLAVLVHLEVQLLRLAADSRQKLIGIVLEISMRIKWNCLVAILLLAGAATAQSPEEDPFTIRKQPVQPGPQITAYLRYQLDHAWRLDERRKAAFSAIRTEEQLRALQASLRDRLLSAIGGLPAEKTPLQARTTGTIQRPGYRIEKVIFESLPGFHVTALLYLPDAPSGPKPAVLVPCGHSQTVRFITSTSVPGWLAWATWH